MNFEDACWQRGFDAGSKGISFRGMVASSASSDEKRLTRNGWVNGRKKWRMQNGGVVRVRSRVLDEQYLRGVAIRVNAELRETGSNVRMTWRIARLVIEAHAETSFR